jgi:hypothetical protein
MSQSREAATECSPRREPWESEMRNSAIPNEAKEAAYADFNRFTVLPRDTPTPFKMSTE